MFSVLSFGEGALWALSRLGGGSLVRIEPATDAVRFFPSGGQGRGLAGWRGGGMDVVGNATVGGLLRAEPATESGRWADPPGHRRRRGATWRAAAAGQGLASVLGVNKNTVLRALHVLREEGLLEFRRGRGITVAGTPERGAVLARLRDLLEFAWQQGYNHGEIIQMINNLPRDA
jgi:hypothetical protein